MKDYSVTGPIPCDDDTEASDYYPLSECEIRGLLHATRHTTDVSEIASIQERLEQGVLGKTYFDGNEDAAVRRKLTAIGKIYMLYKNMPEMPLNETAILLYVLMRKSNGL